MPPDWARVLVLAALVATVARCGPELERQAAALERCSMTPGAYLQSWYAQRRD